MVVSVRDGVALAGFPPCGDARRMNFTDPYSNRGCW